MIGQVVRLTGASLLEVELFAGEAGDFLRECLKQAARLLDRSTAVVHAATPVVLTAAILWGLAAAWKQWHLSAKEATKLTGYNPEGNMEVGSPALQRAQEMLARLGRQGRIQ